jgi:putative Mg2+ transporter-C (MgtC) family protein
MPTSELITRLVVAVALAGALGLEREVRQKHAGLRTHALVGLGAALIVEVSAYGFSDVLVAGKVVVDPSRVAAQVVSGIGFIGAGLIFVRQEYVR